MNNLETIATIEELNGRLEGESPEYILKEVLSLFGNKIRFSSSLGAEDQVITAMLAGIDKRVSIFTLDTGRMFPETYEVLHRTINRYGIPIDVYFPDAKMVETMVNTKGINLFYESVENRKECCNLRKIEPLKRALNGLDAWITGLRRQQSVTRTNFRLIEWDENNQLIKVNPLIEWSDEMVWDYIHKNNVPYNKLHDAGFPSIGCQPCTRSVNKGEDIRAGRWWWELPDNKECGLHKKES
ncbi:MAG: phosphoadenylyl-sulfate reductase [Bacteroidales bacterium]|nr:phosphoadenylyl-sulfate reductase [Bacteroidales bacterium]